MDVIILALANCAILVVVGCLLGVTDKKNFSFRWLVVATLLVVLNDAMLTRVYGWLPRLLPDADWNWQGKLMALGASLLIASLPVFGWRKCGITLHHAAGSLRPSFIVLSLYIAFFVGIAIRYGGEDGTAETIAFQLTMPGIEEEIFFRGILLLALNEAFRGRINWLGVGLGWGALLSSLVFGLGHALSYSSIEGIGFDPLYLALTTIPSLLVVWLRERTGSLFMPILAHNAGNSIPLLI